MDSELKTSEIQLEVITGEVSLPDSSVGLISDDLLLIKRLVKTCKIAEINLLLAELSVLYLFGCIKRGYKGVGKARMYKESNNNREDSNP